MKVTDRNYLNYCTYLELRNLLPIQILFPLNLFLAQPCCWGHAASGFLACCVVELTFDFSAASDGWARTTRVASSFKHFVILASNFCFLTFHLLKPFLVSDQIELLTFQYRELFGILELKPVVPIDEPRILLRSQLAISSYSHLSLFLIPLQLLDCSLHLL